MLQHLVAPIPLFEDIIFYCNDRSENDVQMVLEGAAKEAMVRIPPSWKFWKFPKLPNKLMDCYA